MQGKHAIESFNYRRNYASLNLRNHRNPHLKLEVNCIITRLI